MPLVQDQDVIQALSSHTSQESFTDGIGSWRVIRHFENLDACTGYFDHPFSNKPIFVYVTSIIYTCKGFAVQGCHHLMG